MDKKTISIIIGVAIVFVLGYLFIGSGASVTAQGNSVLKAEPDKIIVSILVQGKGLTAEEAKDNFDKVMENIYPNLFAIGYDKEDLRSNGFNIYPEYEYGSYGSRQKGFIAQEVIEIELTDFDKTSEIVDATIESGALISYIQLGLSDERMNEYKADALREASKDARNKAESTAEGLGKKLGRLISVTSQDFNYIPYYGYAKAEGASVDSSNDEARSFASNIQPNDLEVTAYVSVEYGLWGI